MPLLPPVRVFSDYRTSFGTGCAEAVRTPKRGVREMRKRIVLLVPFVCLFVNFIPTAKCSQSCFLQRYLASYLSKWHESAYLK